MARRPSAWTNRAPGALLALSVAAGGVLRAQGGAAEVREARVDITVDSVVVVHERLTIAGTRTVALEWRTEPCAAVDAPVLTVLGALVAYRDSSSGPWRSVHAELAAGADSTVTLDVNYRVQPAGATWSVPVVLPAAPVRARTGDARDAVVLTVTAPRARPVFPAFTTLAPGRFEARLPAVPSLVRLHPAIGTACAPSSTPVRNELTIRFTLLVLTMLLWIPLYFRWARRREKNA